MSHEFNAIPVKSRALILAAALFLFVSDLGAQAARTSAPPAEVRDWALVLNEVERYIRSTEHDDALTRGQRFLVQRVRARANTFRNQTQKNLQSSQRLLEALGPPPEKGKPPEPKEIAEKRRQYSQDIGLLRARAAEADLAIIRADQLEAALSSLTRERLVRKLVERGPSPLAPHVLADGVPEFFEKLNLLVHSPATWYGGLSQTKREKILFWPGALMILLAGIFSLILRRIILSRFGRDPSIEAPTYSRRLLAAIAEGVARGIIPAAILGVFYLWFSRPEAYMEGLFRNAVVSGIGVFFFFVLVIAFTRGALAPALPAWQLADLAPANAMKISRLITVLAAIFSADLYVAALGKDLSYSEEFFSIYSAIFGIIEALVITSLARQELWRLGVGKEPEGTAQEESEGGNKLSNGRIWTILRWGAAGASLLGAAAMLAGYSIFGKWILSNLILSGLAFGLLALIRGLLHELANLLTQNQIAQERLGVRILQAVQTWERVVVDTLVIIASVMLILPLWGVPPNDLLRWGGQILTGFWIGKIQISIFDILLAVVVFFGAMAATRMVQRLLVERLFTETRLTDSVRHSISAGVGYLGVIIAVILSISVTGIDLTNIALVAGALSVGIGFGLQNIVNNFVSGFILLIERPIKVGDWVIVGEKEGFVKRVSFRATELETWQRASVIIPNAEILSSAVTNWTHRDTYGRIEIKVGVSYGSDVEKVREILLETAKAHPKVSDNPMPKALFMDFGDSSLNFELRCFTASVLGRFDVSSELRFEINRRFKDSGVVIPFPQRVLHMAPSTSAKRAPSPEQPAQEKIP